jgi:hypothetical protein
MKSQYFVWRFFRDFIGSDPFSEKFSIYLSPVGDRLIGEYILMYAMSSLYVVHFMLMLEKIFRSISRLNGMS